jgi:hypothetical protein
VATRIVFQGGAELEVAESPKEVGKAFGEDTGEVFTTLRATDGTQVIVNPDAVAYLVALEAGGDRAAQP